MTKQFELTSPFNMIKGLITIPEHKGRRKYPAAILSHGLVSSKESSKYVALEEILLKSGIAVCRFDYHGCGESTGRIEETSLTKRLDNLSRIVDYTRKHSEIDAERVGIIGSSFGATTALLMAARDRAIKCVSLWATPCLLEKEANGSIDGIVFDDALYTDFVKYDILSEARKVSRTLVIHGDADETVPCSEGKTIHEELRAPKDLKIIPGGDHVFSDPSMREAVLNLALAWFQKYL